MHLRSTEQIEARAVVRHCVVVCYYLHAHRQWRRGYVPLPVSGRLRKPEGTRVEAPTRRPDFALSWQPDFLIASTRV